MELFSSPHCCNSPKHRPNHMIPSPHPRLPKTCTPAFTLMELLAVITVVVALAALLFPTAQNWIAKAKQSQCSSNLRNLSYGITQYAADNNGELPPSNSVTDVGGGKLSSAAWFDLLDLTVFADSAQLPSSKRITMRQCPSNPGRNTYWGKANYAYNAELGNVDVQTSKDKRVRISSVSQPSKLVILTDSAVRRIQAPTPNSPKHVTWYFFLTLDAGTLNVEENTFTGGHVSYQWHKNRSNFLYLDGHVESLTFEDAEKRLEEKSLLLQATP